MSEQADSAAEVAAEPAAPEAGLVEEAIEEGVPDAASVTALARGRRAIDATAAAGAAEDGLGKRLAGADVGTRSAALARLQAGSGNAVIAQRLAGAAQGATLSRLPAATPETGEGDEEPPPELLNLEDLGYRRLAGPEAPPGPAGGPPPPEPLGPGSAGGGGPVAAPVRTGGSRPPIRLLQHDCADCNAAVAHLNSGAYVGEASVQIAPHAGGIRVSGTRAAYTAEVDVSWPIDVAASSMEVTNFVWPNMTSADTAAVDVFRSALTAHEEGHFIEVERVIAAQPTKLRATGATQRAAAEALRAEAARVIAAVQAAISQTTTDYDSRTNHGRTQSAAGGTDVHLQCPRRTVAPGGAGSGGVQRQARVALVARQPSQPQPAVAPAPATPAPAPPQPASAPGDGSPPVIIKAPAPKGDPVVHVPSQVLLSESREHVRYGLEVYFATKGIDLIDRFDTADSQFKLGYTGSPLDPTSVVPAPGSPEEAYRQRVIALTRDEITTLRAQRSILVEHFQRRANDTLNALLDKSKEQVEKDKERYGAKVEGWIFKDYSLNKSADTAELAEYAKKLQAKYQAYHEVAASIAPAPRAELPPGGVPTGEAEAEYKKRQEAIAAAHARLQPLEAEYQTLRREAEGKHPILISYQLELQGRETGRTLTALSTDSGETRAELIVKQISEKLENIEKVRVETNKDPTRIWKLERVVGPTKNLPDVQSRVPLSAAMRDEVIRDKVLTVQLDEQFQNMAIGAVTFAIALVTALPTAGASVAATAAAGTATAAGVAIDAALLAQAVKDYQFESAASATNYDKAKAISQDEPDLFWLALQIVTSSVGASAAVGEIRAAITQIGRLRSEALGLKAAAMQAEGTLAAGLKPKYARALDDLEAAGEKAAPGAGAGKKLRQDVESADPSRLRRTEGPDAPAGKPSAPPVPNAIMQGPGGQPMTRADAFSQYHREIEANPMREYAVLQRGRSEEFCVVIGESRSVQIPRGLPEDWAFVTHYHPSFEWIDPKRMRIVESNFVARIPSPDDMTGAMSRSTMQGKQPVWERLDWRDPSRNTTTVYQTTFGYTPRVDDPMFGTFWVQYPNEMGAMSRMEFKSVGEYSAWFDTLNPAGPPTVRTPSP